MGGDCAQMSSEAHESHSKWMEKKSANFFYPGNDVKWVQFIKTNKPQKEKK